MLSKKIAGMIHAYPSMYLLDSLHQAGWQVVLIVPEEFDDASLLQHPALIDVFKCDFNNEISIVETAINSHQQQSWDVVLPINEGCVDVSAMVAEALSLRGNSLDAARLSRDKAMTYQRLSQANIPHPTSMVVHSYQQAINASDSVPFPAILKLADSMNSQGVIRVNNSEQYKVAMDQLFSMFNQQSTNDFSQDRNIYAYGKSGGKVVIQPFLADEEIGIDLLYCGEKTTMLGIFEKSPSVGPYFAEQYSVYPTSLSSQQIHDACELAKQTVFALGATVGAAHVEIRFSQGRPYVLEAGLRPGGGYTAIACEKLTGINTYVALAELLANGDIPKNCLDEATTRQPDSVLYGGILYDQSGVLTSVSGDEKIAQRDEVLDWVCLAQVGDEVFTMPDAAQPHYAYYLLKAKTREQVLDAHFAIQHDVTLDIRGAEQGQTL